MKKVTILMLVAFLGLSTLAFAGTGGGKVGMGTGGGKVGMGRPSDTGG